jgi:hypothetical protein
MALRIDEKRRLHAAPDSPYAEAASNRLRAARLDGHMLPKSGFLFSVQCSRLGSMSPTAELPVRQMAMATPSPRTRHAELLRLCARIGYSPPAFS